MPRRRQPPSPTLRQLRDVIRAGAVQSQAEAARHIGVSRERIRQLVAKHGLELKRPAEVVLGYACANCKDAIERPQSEMHRLRHPDLCWRCAQASRRRVSTRVCAKCGAKRTVKTSHLRFLVTDLCRTCWSESRRRKLQGYRAPARGVTKSA